MGATLAFHKRRQGALFVAFLAFVGVVSIVGIALGGGGLRVAHIYLSPSRAQYFFSAHLKLNLFNLAQHRGGRKFTVGVEHGYKAQGYEVVNVALKVGKGASGHTRGYDGVVVGNL